MGDNFLHIQLRRKLLSLLPEMRSIPLEDLVTGKPLKWPIKQRLLVALFSKTTLLQEHHDRLLNILEDRNKEVAERRAKGLNSAVKGEAFLEKEAIFKTKFVREVIAGLERVKWPTASIPFSDPLNDLLQDDSTFVDAIDYLTAIIDPSLAFPPASTTVDAANNKPSTPGISKRNQVPSSSSKHISSGKPVPTFIGDVAITTKAGGPDSDQYSLHSQPSARIQLDCPNLDGAGKINAEPENFSTFNIGVCLKCHQRTASSETPHPSLRVLEILQIQNQNLSREVKRLQDLLRRNDQIRMSLQECTVMLKNAIGSEQAVLESSSGQHKGSPLKHCESSPLSKCLSLLESTINQDRLSRKSSAPSSTPVENSFRSTRIQNSLELKLHGELQAFPHEDDKKDLQLLLNELLQFSKEIGLTEEENDMFGSSKADERRSKLRNLRAVAFRLMMRLSRETGSNTISSEGMERSSIWRLNQMLTTIDRKCMPKHILSSLTKECDGILSEFNMIYNTVKLYFGRDKKWQEVSKHISNSLTSTRRNVQAFGNSFREDITPALMHFQTLSKSFESVLKARILDRKSGTQRSVVDLLLNGAMGVEVAEWLMIFREHANIISTLPSIINQVAQTFCKNIETEVGKISHILSSC